MSIKTVLLKFSLIYIGMVLVVSLIMNYFGFDFNSGINSGVLVATIFSVCNEFGRKNKRYFSSKEKKLVIGGMILIDLVFQALGGLAILFYYQKELTSDSFLVWGLIVLVHAIAIYFIVSFVKRSLIKQGVIEK